MTHHQLRTFLAVARTGSLTKAARELNSSQPTVSLQLRALRRSLGTTLLERGDGGFRLTPAGEKLRRYAEETLAGLRAFQGDLAALEGRLAGPLAVGTTFVMSRYVLASVLTRFREEFPEVDLRLHVEMPGPMITNLLAKIIDVACFIKVRTPPELTVEPVGEQEFAIIASPRSRLAGRRRVTAEDLSEEPFVAFGSSLFTEMIEGTLQGAGIEPRVATEGQHHDAVKKLVEANAGYSVLVRPAVADELAGGRLVELWLDGPPLRGPIVVAYRSWPALSPTVHEFTRFVRAELDGRRSSPALTGAPLTPPAGTGRSGSRDARRGRRPGRA